VIWRPPAQAGRGVGVGRKRPGSRRWELDSQLKVVQVLAGRKGGDRSGGARGAVESHAQAEGASHRVFHPNCYSGESH